MRLICPNCAAQYEVDDGMIPDEGRDVQCSSCGHVWFIARPGSEGDAPPDDLGDELGDELGDAPPDERDDAPEADAFPEDDPAENEDPAEHRELSEIVDPGFEEELSAALGAGAAAPAPKPRLDEETREILRAEAAREAQVRKAEAEGLQTQPDLGLADAGPRQADRRGGADIFPDIEEINSSLRPDAERGARQAPQDAPTRQDRRQRRRGFRLGFGLMIFLTGTALLTYVFAPDLAEAFPEARPALTQYVDIANTVRLRLDNALAYSIEELRALVDRFGGTA